MKNSQRSRQKKRNDRRAASDRDKKPKRRFFKEREEPTRIVGVIRKVDNGWRIESTNRRERGDYTLHAKSNFQLEDGQIAVAEKVQGRHRFSREAKLIDIVGDLDSPKAVSLIAIATHEIPTEFTKEAIAEANAAQPVHLPRSKVQTKTAAVVKEVLPSRVAKKNPGTFVRDDLRDIPLVTIDGADARDFDDAVFAEADGEGWHLVVAIADVSHYVTPGSALDACAIERGNSVYFPDRVVPMLPEALSNELCSLKPHVDRACMAVHMWIDKGGELTRWKFTRGVMKSQARLIYEQVQAAMDGQADEMTAPLVEKVLKPLYGAYRCLLAARTKRGTLELDLPERKVEIAHGKVKSISVRARLDSHKLIEEFMIAANVAAAAQLENKKGLCLYRIHDRPTEMKLEALRDFLNSMSIKLVPERELHPRHLTHILENAAGTPQAVAVNEMILRSQSQAIYSPENIGHFGLALAKYAHFTSPIRRYADLVVHRGLIRACGLGEGGLTDKEVETLEEIAEHISTTERRAAAAERDATDRFVTLFLADRVGEVFEGRISGVARFGLFARLNETGADGIIPMASLPDDHYFYDEKRQAMVGKRTKRTFRLSDPVKVKITQADRLTGSMSLTIVDGQDATDSPSPTAQPSERRKAGQKARHRRHK